VRTASRTDATSRELWPIGLAQRGEILRHAAQLVGVAAEALRDRQERLGAKEVDGHRVGQLGAGSRELRLEGIEVEQGVIGARRRDGPGGM